MNSSRPWLRKGVLSVFTLSSVNLLSVTYRVYLPYNIFGDHVTSIFLTKFNTEWCLHFLSVQWSGWKTDKVRERRQTLRSDIVNVCLSLSDLSHSQPHGEVFKSRGLMLSHFQMKEGWGGGKLRPLHFPEYPSLFLCCKINWYARGWSPNVISLIQSLADREDLIADRDSFRGSST